MTIDLTKQEIALGAEICTKIKNAFYANEKWPDCYNQVAVKFSALKLQAKKFYGDKTTLEVLKELRSYSEQDLLDMFYMEHKDGHDSQEG